MFVNFTEEFVSYVPLNGIGYEADRSTIHHTFVSFTSVQSSEDWIRSSHRFNDGHLSMHHFRDHLFSEENAIRRFVEVDRLKDIYTTTMNVLLRSKHFRLSVKR